MMANLEVSSFFSGHLCNLASELVRTYASSRAPFPGSA